MTQSHIRGKGVFFRLKDFFTLQKEKSVYKLQNDNTFSSLRQQIYIYIYCRAPNLKANE